MINNNYNYLGKDYSIGGIINGELDNMVFTGGEECEVWEIELENGYKIALSEKYALFIFIGDTRVSKSKSVTMLEIGQRVYIQTAIPFDSKKIVNINKRLGKNINIPKQMFILNKMYVSTKFNKSDDNYDANLEGTKRESCAHRSPEKMVNKIEFCCKPVEERLDFHCSAKNVFLIQPMCWNCDLYKEKI